jgi:uncharacterized membrane protein
MELALLVYAINLLTPIKTACSIVALLSSVVWVIWKILNLAGELTKGPAWYYTTVLVVSFLMLTALPSERTAYLMVGAYATQKVTESPQVQDLSADVLKIITAKVKQYAEEADKNVKSAN